MLLDRLENDRSLSAFAGQFVPVKLVTDGNPQWNSWARKYPIDANGIPQLYVIRADGEKLYGGVGSLPGDQLPTMLIAALKRSGRAFNQVDAQLLNQAVTESKAALERGDSLQAAIAMSAVTKLGSPDDLGSYAQAAVQAGELYQEIQSKIEADAKDAQERFDASDSDGEDVLASAVVICEAEAAYKLFPKLRRKAAGFGRELRNNKEYREVFNQAEGIVRARSLGASSDPRLRSRVIKAYIDVIRRFPDTDADRLARAEIKKIDPEAVVPDTESLKTKPTPEPSSDGFRTWTARQGNFTTRAKYVQQAGGKVQLMKSDGSKIVVDISILSDQDQAFLRRLQKM